MPLPQVTEVHSLMPSSEIPDRCFASRILNEVIFYALTGRKPARSASLFNAFANQLLAERFRQPGLRPLPDRLGRDR